MNFVRSAYFLFVLLALVGIDTHKVYALSPSGANNQSPAERLQELRAADLDASECNAAMESAESLVSGGGRGGDYVPVHEVGDLLEVNWREAGLTFQICMYLKTLKRIQYEWEEKELITNPDARKASAKAIYEMRRNFFYGDPNDASIAPTAESRYISTYAEEQANKGGSIYVRNTNDHVSRVSAEAQGLFLKDFTDTRPIFGPTIQRSIAEQSAIDQSDTARLKARLTSDFTKQEFEDFTSDFSNGGWGAWLKIIQPKNNPYGQFMIAQEELSIRKTRAEQNAREEVLAGGGFLPNRACAQWDSIPATVTGSTEQKFCRRWETLTPAAAQASQYNQLLGSTLAQAINADEQIEDFIKDELPNEGGSLASGIGPKPNTQPTAPTSIFESEQDPCPGPGPCPTSGWTGTSNIPPGGIGNPTGGGGTIGGNLDRTDNNRNGIPDFLDNEDNRDLYPGLEDLIDRILREVESQQERERQIREFLATQPPTITMTANTPTFAEVDQGQPNQSRITWEVFNATQCVAANDWLTRGTRNGNNFWEGSYTVARSGDTLPLSGRNAFRTIEHPVRFLVDFIDTDRGDPSNSNDDSTRTTRGMVSLSTDALKMTETAQINITHINGFRQQNEYDLLIGRLDGRWDNRQNQPTGEYPALHAEATGCADNDWRGAARLVSALRDTYIARLEPGTPTGNVLRYFNTIFTTNEACRRDGRDDREDNPGWNTGAISITPTLTYAMSCSNNNVTGQTSAYAEVRLQRTP